jgi:hypothetical protein
MPQSLVTESPLSYFNAFATLRESTALISGLIGPLSRAPTPGRMGATWCVIDMAARRGGATEAQVYPARRAHETSIPPLPFPSSFLLAHVSESTFDIECSRGRV